MLYYLPFLIFLLFSSCSSPEKRACKQNLKGEYIFRRHNEYFFTPLQPQLQTRENYPWENHYIHGLPRIQKEFFRCKGNRLNPPIIQEKEGKESLKLYDCPGSHSHGLPLRGEEEFIYPCLIELLNTIQEKTKKRVVITCGHRCPKHNTYADPSSYNWSSKHMLGAEVDFYVEGWEEEPQKVIDLIQNYYQEHPQFKNSSDYTHFSRYTNGSMNVATSPWFNKEIFIKLYQAHEGRDIDNTHPFPYLSIQVRYDRELNSRVSFDPKAAQNYLRH